MQLKIKKMRNTVLTLIVIFTVILNTQAQLSNIPENQIKINDEISYFTTATQLKSILGDPLNITSEYWEMEELSVQKYHYSGADFYIKNGILASFKLTSPNYYLKLNTTQIKVGNLISTIQSAFPSSYNSRNNGVTGINIGTGDYIYIYIEYNTSNKITCIEQRYY